MIVAPFTLDNNNPENIISAPPGTYLYRNGSTFTVDGSSLFGAQIYDQFLYYYRQQPWFTSMRNTKILNYSTPEETWFKGSGYGKTGWVFLWSRFEQNTHPNHNSRASTAWSGRRQLVTRRWKHFSVRGRNQYTYRITQ